MQQVICGCLNGISYVIIRFHAGADIMHLYLYFIQTFEFSSGRYHLHHWVQISGIHMYFSMQFWAHSDVYYTCIAWNLLTQLRLARNLGLSSLKHFSVFLWLPNAAHVWKIIYVVNKDVGSDSDPCAKQVYGGDRRRVRV